jgi:hypothetical protein
LSGLIAEAGPYGAHVAARATAVKLVRVTPAGGERTAADGAGALGEPMSIDVPLKLQRPGFRFASTTVPAGMMRRDVHRLAAEGAWGRRSAFLRRLDERVFLSYEGMELREPRLASVGQAPTHGRAVCMDPIYVALGLELTPV